MAEKVKSVAEHLHDTVIREKDESDEKFRQRKIAEKEAYLKDNPHAPMQPEQPRYEPGTLRHEKTKPRRATGGRS